MHCKEKHEGKKQKFKCNVREIFGKDATLRQITEATDIRREEAGMNNKFECGAHKTPQTWMGIEEARHK